MILCGYISVVPEAQDSSATTCLLLQFLSFAHTLCMDIYVYILPAQDIRLLSNDSMAFELQCFRD